MKKTFAAVATVVAALCMMVGPAAADADAQHVTIFAQGDSEQTVISTGAFFAVGQAVPIDDDNDLFTFPDGTFHVNHPQTGGSDNLNTTTCIGTSTFTGAYTLSAGTGAYAGISGGGTYSGKVLFLADRTDTGCSETDGHLLLLIVNANGTVSLP
jgi:hypothetical protein